MQHPEPKIKKKTAYFAGVSSRMYPFTLYPLHTNLSETGVVYIYTKVGCGFYEPLYIGETDNLKTHIEDYENGSVSISTSPTHYVSTLKKMLRRASGSHATLSVNNNRYVMVIMDE